MYTLPTFLFWSEPIYLEGKVKNIVMCPSAALTKKYKADLLKYYTSSISEITEEYFNLFITNEINKFHMLTT